MSPHCHIVGTGGTGMSALAQVLLAAGFHVTGSDRSRDNGLELPIFHKLGRAGVALGPQDGSCLTDDTEAVVVSSAIEDDNPDLAAARELKVPIVHRAEMLARLLAGRPCAAVAGTCGKTTVTGMVGWALEQLGRDPTVVNGGELVDWSDDDRVGNVRIGNSGLWLIEADESDRSLLNFHPDYAVITNMSRDHFDERETLELFSQFSAQVNGPVVGAMADETLPLTDVELSAAGAAFKYRGVQFNIRLTGRHNVENAASAVALCEAMGCGLDETAATLQSFSGIRRRLEIVASTASTAVIDDYAHNPAKISAAWNAVSPHYRRVIGIWRPHGFGPLAFMREELCKVIKSLARTDDLFCVLPVYYAGGTATRTVTSKMFVEDLTNAGVNARLVEDTSACTSLVSGMLTEGDAVLVMGARDPELPTLARNIAAGSGLG